VFAGTEQTVSLRPVHEL